MLAVLVMGCLFWTLIDLAVFLNCLLWLPLLLLWLTTCIIVCHFLFGCNSFLSESASFSLHVCHMQDYFFLFLSLPCIQLVSILLSLLYVRLLALDFCNHVMLFTLKKETTTSSFYLCHLLFVLSVIIESGAKHTSVCLYIIVICTDHS